ncbi:MAG: FAD-dependent oxidoreductase [Acidobacteriales bacterium]|nr:FAD-dependent oxidoreductase [Terriglobales bacterium]
MARASADIIIIGAGIIGLSLALELRRSGEKVLVLDRSEPGREASYAGAGMLAAAEINGPSPLALMAKTSAGMYAAFVRSVQADSNVRVDFRRQGTIALGGSGAKDKTPIGREELRRLEPGLVWRGKSAYFLHEDCVDPRSLMKALLRSARKRGVRVQGHSRVHSVGVRMDIVTGVHTAAGHIPSRVVVNCAGAWAGARGLGSVPARPVRGHLLALAPRNPDLLRHVVRHHANDIYLLPRTGGPIVVGSTLEEAGFRKAVDPVISRSLRCAAEALLPALRSARVVERWTGLRPGSPDDLPILGPTPVRGYYVATGHYRNGILLAPVTALLMSQLITGSEPTIDLAPFSPLRFSQRAH